MNSSLNHSIVKEMKEKSMMVELDQGEKEQLNRMKEVVENFDQSLNSVLVTLVEIIDHMEQAGLHIYERLPTWMEEPLNQVISQYGIQTVV